LLAQTYRLIFQSNLNVSQGVARVKEEVEILPEVQKVLDFIATSKRGILPGSTHR